MVFFLKHYVYVEDDCNKGYEGFGRGGRGGGGRGGGRGGGGRGGGGRGGGGRGGRGRGVGPRPGRVAHRPGRRGRRAKWRRGGYYSPYYTAPWHYYRYNYPDWYDYGSGADITHNRYRVRRNYAPEYHDRDNENYSNEDLVEIMHTCKSSSSSKCNIIVNDRKKDRRYRYSTYVDWDELVPMKGVDTYVKE